MTHDTFTKEHRKLPEVDLADPANDFVRLANRLDDLAAAVARIETAMSTVVHLAELVSDQAKPFLDGLASSTLIKMMGIKL